MGMNPIPKAFGMDSFSKARCGELNQRLVLHSFSEGGLNLAGPHPVPLNWHNTFWAF